MTAFDYEQMAEETEEEIRRLEKEITRLRAKYGYNTFGIWLGNSKIAILEDMLAEQKCLLRRFRQRADDRKEK